MPKKIIAVLLSVLVIMTAFVVPAFAAEGDPVEEQPIQYANNLVPFPYLEMQQTIYGVTFTVQNDGGIHVVGTPSTSFAWRFAAELYLKTEEYYTLSAKYVEGDTVYYQPDEVNIIAHKMRANGTSGIWLNLKDSFAAGDDSATGRLLEGENVVWLGLFLSKDVSTDVVVYPMFNIGQSPSPYMLYLPYLLNQKFQEGYDQGYEEGYQPGYNEGYKVGEGAGIIQGTESGYSEGYQAALDSLGANVDLFTMPFEAVFDGYYIDNITVRHDIAYDLATLGEVENGALDLSGYFDFFYMNEMIGNFPGGVKQIGGDFILDFQRDDLNTGVFLFSSNDDLFEIVHPYMRVFDVSCIGYDASGSEIGITLTRGDQILVEDSLYKSVYRYEGQQDLKNCTFYELRLNFNFSISDGLHELAGETFTIDSGASVKGTIYVDGYNQGYKDGSEKGADAVKKVYYDQGYNQGFKYGKQEGLKIAESGGWNSLMTAIVEAPVNAFQGLFNFEILGLDMRVAVGSILTLCVVIIVIKKVIL